MVPLTPSTLSIRQEIEKALAPFTDDITEIDLNIDEPKVVDALEALVLREKKVAVEQALALAYAEVCGSREGVGTHGPEKFIEPIVNRLFPS